MSGIYGGDARTIERMLGRPPPSPMAGLQERNRRRARLIHWRTELEPDRCYVFAEIRDPHLRLGAEGGVMLTEVDRFGMSAVWRLMALLQANICAALEKRYLEEAGR